MNLRHGARHNMLHRASVLPGKYAPRSDGWLGAVDHGVAKRSRSLERPDRPVSSSSWGGEQRVFIFWPPARADATNYIFMGKNSQSPTVIWGKVLQNLHVCRCVEKDERKPIICHSFWGRSGFKVDA